MSIKMRELVKRSGIPKSTILYYIKEGLLPQPQKPKPNLHLYDEDMVDKIHLISYLQKQFDASIAEIKSIMASKVFNWDEGFSGIWETLNILMGAKHMETYSHADVCGRFDITPHKLDSYLQRELLFLRDGHFTDKELERFREQLMVILEAFREIDEVAYDSEAFAEHKRFFRRLLSEHDETQDRVWRGWGMVVGWRRRVAALVV